MSDYSNSSMWVRAKGSPRWHPADATCMAKPALNAAWPGTPTAPGMDRPAHGTSRHPKGTVRHLKTPFARQWPEFGVLSKLGMSTFNKSETCSNL